MAPRGFEAGVVVTRRRQREERREAMLPGGRKPLHAGLQPSLPVVNTALLMVLVFLAVGGLVAPPRPPSVHAPVAGGGRGDAPAAPAAGTLDLPVVTARSTGESDACAAACMIGERLAIACM